MKTLGFILIAATLSGCGPNEADRQRVANEASTKAQEQAAILKDKLKSAYDSAYAEGKKIAVEAGGQANDQVLKAKVLAAFKLIKSLDSSKVEVRVEKGVIYLDGSVRTEQERMMAEGLAYGVTGDGKRVRSTLTVPKPAR
jgi:osmotically-inducible protein OsmY